MTLYYKSSQLVARIRVDKGVSLKRMDAVMARDGMKRCTRKEYLAARADIRKTEAK